MEPEALMPQQEAEWVDRSSLPQQVRYRDAQGWRLVHTVEPGRERSALLVVWEKPVSPELPAPTPAPPAGSLRAPVPGAGACGAAHEHRV